VNQGRKATDLYKLRWLSCIIQGTIMKTLRICTLLLLISNLIGISAPTFAASTDFTHTHNYTSDTITGLDWLDLTETTNRSYNDVINGMSDTSSVIYGYRYATLDDWGTLISNFFDVAKPSDNTTSAPVTNFGAAQVFHTNFGITNTRQQSIYTFTDSLGFLKGDTSLYLAGIQSGHATITGYTSSSNLIQREDGATTQPASIYVGHFLVKGGNLIATPLPAALFLFAPALFGFFGFRRKMQA